MQHGSLQSSLEIDVRLPTLIQVVSEDYNLTRMYDSEPSMYQSTYIKVFADSSDVTP